MSAVKTVDRPGRTELDGRVYLDYARRYVVKAAALPADNIYRIPVEKGKVVLGLRTLTTVAWQAATTIKAGDLSNDDGFMPAATDIVALGTLLDSRHLHTEAADGVATYLPFANGVSYLDATGQIILTFNQDPNAGELEVEVIFRGYEAATKDVLDH